MPKAKKTVSKAKKTAAAEEPMGYTPDMHTGMDENKECCGADGACCRRHRAKKIVCGAVVVALLAFFAWKGFIIAAVVDGKPIFGWTVINTVMSRYGKQTLESMVSETMVQNAARKAGVTVSQSDIDVKVNELVATLGENVKLEDLLSYQGMTKSEFESQVRLQLLVEKLLGKDVVVTDKAIDDYIVANKATLTSTDAGKLREEAKQAIFSQEVNTKIQPWFADIKAKSSVIRILK